MLQRLRSVAFAVMTFSILVHASCSAQTSSGQGEYREFRDERGRTVTARVVEAGEEKVTIERRDGRTFTLDISAFSQADQD